MDPVEAGLLFLLGAVDSEAGAILLPNGSGLTIRAEHRWGGPLLAISHELWERASGGDSGVLLAPPVLGLPVVVRERLAGLACVAVPAAGRPMRSVDVMRLAQYLVELAMVTPAGTSPRVGLDLIHQSAEPAVALVRHLERAGWNVAALARRLCCTRKAIYAAARRYSVRIAPRRSCP